MSNIKGLKFRLFDHNFKKIFPVKKCHSMVNLSSVLFDLMLIMITEEKPQNHLSSFSRISQWP